MLANDKFILNFAPTGLIPTKEMTPNVPVKPEEIVEQTLEAAELGANMVHLHALDGKTHKPSHSKEVYAEIINGIRKKNKALVICVSTSGRLFPEYEKRSDVLNLNGELRPDMASLTLSSLNFNKQASINSPDTIKMLAGVQPDMNTLVGIEILESQETPGLGQEIASEKFKSQFNGLRTTPDITYVKNQKPSEPNEIEAITGATISSRAVVTILNGKINELREK